MGLAYDRALGMVETLGLVGAVEALDAMAKTAEVRLRGPDLAGAGLYLVSVNGSVGSVKAAVEAGARAAARFGPVVGVHIIPKPDEMTDGILPRTPPASAGEAPRPAAKKPEATKKAKTRKKKRP